MISQCSICDEPYSTKDFITAKKRVCSGCKAKTTKDEPTRDEGRGIESVKSVNTVKLVEPVKTVNSATVENGYLTGQTKGAQIPVWAK